MPWLATRRVPIHAEGTFRHLLAVERQRAARARRSCLLVLVSWPPALQARLTPRLHDMIFSALDTCVREIDIVGWFRDARAVGAVLTQGDGAPADAARGQIAARVRRSLAEHLPADAAEMRVRIVRL